MKLAVLDRDRSVRTKIAAAAATFPGHSNPIDVMEFDSIRDFLCVCRQSEYDCVFASVETAVDLEFIWQLRERDEQIPIAFICDNEDFGLIGFRLGIVHYLIKPLEAEQIVEAIRRSGNKNAPLHFTQAMRSRSILSRDFAAAGRFIAR